MEDPVSEIPNVIRLLTHSPPSEQEKTVEQFFTTNAAFTHPFCRVCSFPGSRWFLLKIFQWYKIMSPRIETDIHSIAFDEQNLKLYVTLSQIFSIWIVPFHVSPVTLTTVLTLTTGQDGASQSLPNGEKRLYYIARQDDLYSTSEWIKFLIPHIGHWLVMIGQLFATIFCVMGVFVLYPVMWLEEKKVIPDRFLKKGNLVYNIERKIPEMKKGK
ncbi:hypothetical protein ASPZODRAFT_128710 [Penicilliopsis zonata CBS 506.65]|uniref:SigF-like NTF2-like domain-containing protein n=1 Tax=Penicilliopsis zonata CBS 506.65 TaxID=1073090 RepID=A0A1L9SSL6_9EURO|nr:hypothetical protein ASPZODRAFT_128710 [Penicilliopsis zonata CBS 506.65]OJJ50106.1 hypothetical protein ASPZODRAFT_128710 [Penicilliopsis zonata CBS 506.65]